MFAGRALARAGGYFGQHLQQLLIAEEAADILWRGGALAGGQDTAGVGWPAASEITFFTTMSCPQ